jgi:hypothetical protein
MKLRARLRVEASDGQPIGEEGIGDLIGQWTTYEGRPAQIIKANVTDRGFMHLTLEYEEQR